MANNNDFRRYEYDYETYEALKAFNLSRGTEAPVLEPIPKPELVPKKVKPENPRKKEVAPKEAPTKKKKKNKRKKGASKKEHKQKDYVPLTVEERQQSRLKEDYLNLCDIKGFLKILCIVLVTSVFSVMFAGIVYTDIVKTNLTNKIADTKEQIAIVQGENTSLNSELEAMVSMAQIDSYAVEKLGMVKLNPNQIKYINASKLKNGEVPFNILKDSKDMAEESIKVW